MLTTMMMAAAATVPMSAPVDLNSWVSHLNDRVSQRMERQTEDVSGLAVISFRRDEKGRPVDIKVNSGSMPLARVAIRTLRTLGTLPPMPAFVPASQRVTLNFLVGKSGDEDEFYAAQARLLDGANRTNTALAMKFGSGTQLASREP